jgi:hypothetical protein
LYATLLHRYGKLAGGPFPQPKPDQPKEIRYPQTAMGWPLLLTAQVVRDLVKDEERDRVLRVQVNTWASLIAEIGEAPTLPPLEDRDRFEVELSASLVTKPLGGGWGQLAN